MQSIRSFSLALAILGALPLGASAAHDAQGKDPAAANATAGKLVPVTEKDAAFVAKAKTEYPTNMCVVSGDKLGGDMGKPIDYIYRVDGKPDRLITFCCKDCIGDFNKDPGKYLKILNGTAAKKGDAKSKHSH
ncbi:MAG: hypothetical protein Q7S40_07110 [Opitutaceae bacterium]|nr:hypothetical protein [Opitutaceae bacterium]